jgi:putative sterol carrier protein
VLGQIFKRMPELLSPTGRKSNGVIRFDIGDRRAVDTWYVTLARGTCQVSESPDGVRPRVTISLSAYDFVQLATGADAIRLFSAGKLRLAGDTYFGASIGELFDIAP